MDICEIIPSIRNKHKINVHGFIMVKDKNRNYMYYWYCEKRDMLNCKGRATTILTEDQHHLVKATDHNHAAEANRVKVIKAIKLLKERSQQSNNNPVQVIQSIVAGTSQDAYPYLPSRDALRQMDLTVGEEKVLIFTTTSNIKYLAQSNFWLADRTFKTVPTIFRQLYTIHGSIGSNENSRIMPLVYALMSNKSEVAYRALFQELIDFGYEHDVDLQPQFIITDFEIAAINAIRAEFQGVQNKGCHFHLSQNIYRKVQELGLTVQYGTDKTFSLLIHHIPALAFLPHNNIPSAFDELRAIMPEEANSIMEWFEIYYIRGRIRRTTRSGNIIRSDPLFPPQSGQSQTILSTLFLEPRMSSKHGIEDGIHWWVMHT
ncbi:unnamed protein product [Rhizophagus irregularis]|uniref:MULE transposase domain-containing protein n=1 Tax=Rhizophagus irregularis TaxID=588596 RepID=A0A916EHE2_9GLOM|nr:unnamed protein product [Rhizophagus irregularis]CAB5388520.1 unnamed protein product [Rhizophagus irregularis]